MMVQLLFFLKHLSDAGFSPITDEEGGKWGLLLSLYRIPLEVRFCHRLPGFITSQLSRWGHDYMGDRFFTPCTLNFLILYLGDRRKFVTPGTRCSDATLDFLNVCMGDRLACLRVWSGEAWFLFPGRRTKMRILRLSLFYDNFFISVHDQSAMIRNER